MSSKQYRPDIDGLRAVAILSVLAFHAFPGRVPGGFVGVDIFFVISGFLITSIITNEMEAKTFSFATFYARRARRIFPALTVVLAALLVAGWFLLLADEYAAVGKHTAAGAGFISNIALFLEAGYFDASAKFKPLLHLWSLGIEEQFYLIWPALLLVGAPSRRWRWIAGALAATSLAYCFWLTPRNGYAAFFLPLARFWELMVGALLARPLFGGSATLLLNTVALREAASICGAILIAIAVIVTREGNLFPAPLALFAVGGAALLIAAGPNTTINRFVLGNRVAVFVGLISYPLYLWHWPMLSVPYIIGDLPPRIVRISAISAAFLFAMMTYWAVERPLRASGHLQVKAISSAAALVGVGIVGYAIYVFGGAPHRLEITMSPKAREQIVGSLWQYTVDDDCKARFPLAGVESYGYWFCKISSPRPPTIMIVGSSYANHYYPGLAHHPDLAKETVLSIGACDPAWIDENDVRPSLDVFSPCTSARRLAQQELINGIAATNRLKLVVLSGFAAGTISPDYIERIRRRVDFFEQQGATVAIFSPHVTFDLPISTCFPRPLKQKHEGCNFQSERVDNLRQSFRPLVQTLRQSNPNAIVFDPNEIFCKETCSFVRDGMPLFRDGSNHFSEYASALLANRFMALMRERLSPTVAPAAEIQ